LNFNDDINTIENMFINRVYELPDKSLLELSKEMYKIPEKLF
jgi:hypothetical protein